MRGKELSESELEQLKTEDDSAVVVLDGKEVSIEQAIVPVNKGLTGFPYINGLLYPNGRSARRQGGGTTFTYSFMNAGRQADTNGYATQTFDWTSTNETKAVIDALKFIESVAGVSFTPVGVSGMGGNKFNDSSADFKFFKVKPGTSPGIVGNRGAAYRPTASNINRGLVFFNSKLPDWNNKLRPGEVIYSTVFHEIMHGLGVAHPFEGTQYPLILNEEGVQSLILLTNLTIPRFFQGAIADRQRLSQLIRS